MYYEPVWFPDIAGMGPGYVFNTGFTEAPGGLDHLDAQVFNEHTYCC